MNEAEILVSTLLEDNHDEHVKAYNRVKKYDGAMATFRHLSRQARQAHKLRLELGQALAIDRALAHKGHTRQDVQSFITGDAARSTDNFKMIQPVTFCANHYCSRYNRPTKQNRKECFECGEPMRTEKKAVSRMDMHTKFGDWIVGANLRDGRTLMFDDPIPPRTHEYGLDDETAEADATVVNEPGPESRQ